MFTNEWTQKMRMPFYRALLCGLLVVMPFCTMYSVVCKSEKAYLFIFSKLQKVWRLLFVAGHIHIPFLFLR